MYFYKIRNVLVIIIIIIIIKSIYKAPCLRVIKPAQRRYTKVGEDGEVGERGKMTNLH